jgi:AGCS family alanine or glycine:cation symporter
LIILLFGTHLFLTFRLGFIQRYMGRAIKLTFRREPGGQGDVSHFGALATALAATVGTGNIVGVASAIAAGGPGAVFWMWLTGVFGIATKYGEAVLAIKYRVTNAKGEMAGGPMYVLERGMNAKWLGIIFAALTAVAAFGIGNMTQANAIVTQVQTHWPDVNPQTIGWFVGLSLATITAAVILGGVRWIARVCEFLVPFMVIGYLLGCTLILIKNFSLLGQSLSLIFQGAFSGHQAIAGGFAGAMIKEVVRAGIARGLFSNESGLGSAPIVAAAAKTPNPVRQGLVSASGTFWDTVVICAFTGLVLVSSGHWSEGMSKAALTHAAFADLHTVGPILLAIGLGTFVFSTILGWSYYGEKAIEYLFGLKAVLPYRLLWVAVIVVGAVLPIQMVWDFSDIANGLMAVPNLICLIVLSGVIAAETKANRAELTGKTDPK